MRDAMFLREVFTDRRCYYAPVLFGRSAPAAGLLLTLLSPAAARAQEPPPDQPGPLTQLVTTIGRDFKAMASPDSLTILGIGGTLAISVTPFDQDLTHAAACSTFLKTTFGSWAKVSGEEYVQAGSALATYFTGRIAGQPRIAQVGRDLMEAQLMSALVTQTLKFATDRTRPDGELRSFPSGHASSTFAGAAVLQRHFGWKAGVPAFTAATLISGSRLQANSHFASDVIFGASLGLVVGRSATLEVAGRRFSVAPTPVAGGMALTFSALPN
jgi:membrane-associated phospholipid phosphatase